MLQIKRYLTSLIMSKSRLPVVVILGCTGTGKSKLAINLATKFGGEIISADSMQVYKGLDIVTNKVSVEEQKLAPHHCIDFLDPLQRYTVVDYRNQSLPLLTKLYQDQKLPIIVGGTNYYIESLLWEVLIQPNDNQNILLYESDNESPSFHAPCDAAEYTAEVVLKYKITQNSLDGVPSLDLHKCLKEIDPDMADALHPQDRRKIIRSLQVYQQTGCRHSELLKKQHSQIGGSTVGGPLRFKRILMFWLKCDKDVLDKRLDDRVDEMISRGLLSELIEFHNSYNKKGKNNKHQYSEGIFQSIGFKEFHNYISLSDEEKESAEGIKLLNHAIEDMKLATRQYARKQRKWIVNRFLRKPDRQVPPVYGLDVTDLSLWEENVEQPAIDIVNSFIENKTVYKALPIEEGTNDVQETHFCEVCEKILVGRQTWQSESFTFSICIHGLCSSAVQETL
ncbi:tRNA dimethylallyltransferase isoform X2 [Parasteatoda tepidariorum]|uniref:tRNA dimethylallyltransferase isoform X2 n=1 Tax=Parasteatoda tepidariorum TaxID=114398 RepID=UPI00077FB776|nr:tRNA dimethylallyltransferase isoform X2 [Parasteatoda tepidariorum]